MIKDLSEFKFELDRRQIISDRITNNVLKTEKSIIIDNDFEFIVIKRNSINKINKDVFNKNLTIYMEGI